LTPLDKKIIGQSPAAIQLKKMIALIAPSDAPAIIFGATGSGKELVAEALHEESRRKGRFVTINCAAIPKELIEAEIFGFEKGAFTGAVKSSTGKFEQAQKGTLFLDEIGDMPADLQTKLLRVLENSVISKVGSNSEIKLDVRIVCATHKNLNELVASNKFREDLLFRLNVFPIDVPNLSQRNEDIPEIIEHFIEKKNSKSGSSAHPVFDNKALEALQNYDWPGNIREVRNIVERAIVFFPKAKITDEDVKKYLLRIDTDVVSRAEEQEAIWSELDELGTQMSSDEATTPDNDPPSPKDFANWFDRNNSVDLRSLLRDIEIVFIEAAMDRNGGNTSEAAKDLKLIRTTLIEKIRKYGI
jgi:sigma-54 specific flagellar transcriptional regulator A